mgnify:CR=1 FL=1
MTEKTLLNRLEEVAEELRGLAIKNIPAVREVDYTDVCDISKLLKHPIDNSIASIALNYARSLQGRANTDSLYKRERYSRGLLLEAVYIIQEICQPPI